MFPEDLKYAQTHEWARKEGKYAIIGVTHYAQEQLGDVVFVELPEEGDELDKGEIFATIESVKSVSDVYLPVSGTITEINEGLLDKPELINQSPYEDGWLVKVEIKDKSELENLLSSSEYEDSLN